MKTLEFEFDFFFIPTQIAKPSDPDLIRTEKSV